jgi:oxalate---CoA ligase
MEDAGSKLLIIPPAGNAAAEAAAASLGLPVATAELDAPAGGPPALRVADKAAGANGGLALASAAAEAAAADAAAAPPAPLASDVALFLHTSGTTSKPKGVPLTHGNIAASLGESGWVRQRALGGGAPADAAAAHGTWVVRGRRAVGPCAHGCRPA